MHPYSVGVHLYHQQDGALCKGGKVPQRRQGNGEKGDARRTGMPKKNKKAHRPHKRTDKGAKKRY